MARVGRPVLLVCVLACVLAGCGGPTATAPTTVSSGSYSCTEAALATLPQLRRTIAQRVPRAASRPRVRNYCDGGLRAGVEFTMLGTVRGAVPLARRALHCGDPRARPGATGRTAVLICRSAGLPVRLTLAPYLPADDPRGPTVLGEASLLGGRS
ncbi:MAG: hypothetical protein ACTHJH_11845 [Marmoricola sp.]